MTIPAWLLGDWDLLRQRRLERGLPPSPEPLVPARGLVLRVRLLASPGFREFGAWPGLRPDATSPADRRSEPASPEEQDGPGQFVDHDGGDASTVRRPLQAG